MAYVEMKVVVCVHPTPASSDVALLEWVCTHMMMFVKAEVDWRWQIETVD